jgi:3-hydroxybutyrate dehydrogenase
MNTGKLRGKGAIVTGAGSGINLAFAKALYGYGCSVLIADLRLHTDATAWLKSIEAVESAVKVEFHKTDVSKWAELEGCFDAFAEKIGGVPYLVCPGAGIYEPVSCLSNSS